MAVGRPYTATMLNTVTILRIAIMIFLFAVSCASGAQISPTPAKQSELRIAELPPASYPPMALAAHVSGDVELEAVVRLDGTLESVAVLSGPAMLKQAAVAKARETRFGCEQCSQAATTFHIVFRFELGEARSCEVQDSSYPRITQSANAITITERPFGTCDPSVSLTRTRVRSIRCLFLWRCKWEMSDR
jgi:TonB family protein